MKRFSFLRASIDRRVPGLLGLSALAAGAVGGTVGCHSSDSGTIQIIVDDEAGTFTQTPAPTELQVLAVQSADASTVLATAQLPTSTIDLGKLDESGASSINITGFDTTQSPMAPVVFGAGLPLQYGEMAGQTIPIFVQRKGQLARLPAALSDSRTLPLLSILQGQYLLVAGGNEPASQSTTQLFDFLWFDAVSAPPTLPVVPTSLAPVGTVAWLVNATGATYFDFSNSGQLAVTLPDGGSVADVAGGATVVDDSGIEYIVGGTRSSGAPSATVLEIDTTNDSNGTYPYGTPSWVTLTTPRLGAAAAWVVGRGLVVAGGNIDPNAAGVEILASNTTSSTPLPIASDPTFGAGAAALDGTHILMAGGTAGLGQDAGLRAIDVTCASLSSPCVQSWGSLPVALGSAQAFTWSTVTDGLVVGNEVGAGTTHVYRLNSTSLPASVTEVPTRMPHTFARAVWSPVGSLVLFGGASGIESFIP